MKIKNGFVLKEVNGKSIVVATGEASRYFKGMLTLNEMGKRIFTALQTETNESRIADEIMEEYETVRVADLYDLVGITGNYTDNNYGWTNIKNAQVVRVRDGYKIKMPRAIPLK